MHRFAIVVSVIVVALIGLMVIGARPTAFAQEGTPAAMAGEGFVGAWRFDDVTLDLPSLGSFMTDGNFIVSNLSVEPVFAEADFQILLISTGHGVWEATGDDTADFTYAYLYVNERGEYQSVTTTSGTLELGADGQTLSGEYAYEVRVPDGTVVHADFGTIEATRLGIIPMDELVPAAAGTPVP